MKMFSLAVRKIIAAICLFTVGLSLASCTVPEDEVIASLGKYESREFFTSGGFQDYTDYAKYAYTSAEVSGNKYLKQIRKEDRDEINRHLDDFEEWIAELRDSEVGAHYDFDRGIIDTEDYIYIDSEEHTWSDGHTSLVRYNIYFFDAQTQILYYFHNNI